MATSKRKKRAPERLFCNGCHKDTLHDLLKEVSDTVADDVNIGGGELYTVWEKTTNQMFECRGCKSVVLRCTWIYSEYDIKEARYFPPPVARLKPKWFGELPSDLQELLSEIYRSLDADTRALPMMGARAVLDRVIVDTIGDAGSFEQKLKRLEEERHISTKGREILDAALDAGSAAAHRGYAPTVDYVHSVMDIVENLVHSAYVLEGVAKEIKKDTPLCRVDPSTPLDFAGLQRPRKYKSALSVSGVWHRLASLRSPRHRGGLYRALP
jgi:Domain of unknown function (DUF4145)